MGDDESKQNPTDREDDAVQQHGDQEKNELLEKIRQLEEENKKFEDEIERLEKENTIFKRVLRLKGIDPDTLIDCPYHDPIDVEKLIERNRQLEFRVSMNSTNSSKPPSSDGYRKPSPKSRRVKTGKPRGAQAGHTGHHMKLPHEPDVMISHPPKRCTNCPHLDQCLDKGTLACAESRYTVDTEIRARVTEHRTLSSDGCPLGHPVDTGTFPDDVKARVQYGDGFVALSGLLSSFGAVSISRISTLMKGMFGVSISTGTIQQMICRCAEKVAPVMPEIRDRILDSDVADFDETGLRVSGKLGWVHNSSTQKYTYQTISSKRGYDGMEENGVLPSFKGVAVHDCWMPYWKFPDMGHATCGAHFLRELTAIQEMEPDHGWPKDMADLLMRMKSAKEEAIQSGEQRLSDEVIGGFRSEYDTVMSVADRECPPPPEPSVRHRGRKKRGKERALIERLMQRMDSVCMFIEDFRVPFDNNQAERDVRNVKTKSKVSGCFRTKEGAQNYLTMMSYIGTGNKHGIDAYHAMMSAFDGRPDIVL